MVITTVGMHIDEFDYEPFEIDASELASPPDEAPFGRAAFELHKDLGRSLVLVVGAYRLDDEGRPRGLTLAGVSSRFDGLALCAADQAEQRL